MITAVVSYTFMLSIATEAGIQHRSHNESRVLIKDRRRLAGGACSQIPYERVISEPVIGKQ